MSRHLVIAACWADGDPSDLTAELAERVKGFKADDSKGSIVSFAPATVDYSFRAILHKLDLAEVADAHPGITQPVLMCQCKPRAAAHSWEPGESCPPERVPPSEGGR